jgi:serine/threonine protein kinase
MTLTEIKLDPPPFVSSEYIGFGLYGRIALLRENHSRCFKFCEPLNKDGVKALENEKKILERLGAHKYIIELHWVHERGLCFEYYPHGSLRSYFEMRSSALPSVVIRTRWCRQVAEGVRFIHSKGIIHNDIGARNILITTSMDIKICDFGFATEVGDKVLCVPDTGYTRHPSGMCNACLIDDLFALGSLFYEILNGVRPYADVESDEVQDRFESGVFPPLNCLQPQYFAGVINKCWNAEYNSILELQEELNSLSASELDDLSTARGFERMDQV